MRVSWARSGCGRWRIAGLSRAALSGRYRRRRAGDPDPAVVDRRVAQSDPGTPGKSDVIDASAVALAAIREGIESFPTAFPDERAMAIRRNRPAQWGSLSAPGEIRTPDLRFRSPCPECRGVVPSPESPVFGGFRLPPTSPRWRRVAWGMFALCSHPRGWSIASGYRWSKGVVWIV